MSGHIGTIRVKLDVHREVPPSGRIPPGELAPLFTTAHGEPSEIVDVRRELTEHAQSLLGTTDVAISRLEVRTGSLEVLVVVSAVVTVTKDFGAVMQGLRELQAFVPERVAALVRRRMKQARGESVVTAVSSVAVELGPGLLYARQIPDHRQDGAEPDGSDPTTRRKGRAERVTVNALLTLLVAVVAVMVLRSFTGTAP